MFKEPFVVVGTRGRGPVVVMKRDLQEGHNVHVVRAREQPSATEPPAIAATRDLALRLQGYSRDDDPLGAYYLLRQSWDDVRKTQYQHTKDFVAAPDFLLGPFYADADWLGWRAEEVSRFPAAARDEEVNLKAALFRAVAGNRLPEPLFASDSQANGPLNMKLQSDRDWPAGFLLALAYEQLAALNEVSKVVAAYVLHRLIRERDSILPATSALLGSLPRAHRELVEAAIGAFRGRRAGP
ncbi:MAG: hypothetical protein HY552_00420 [Elusimicrobia bacterium]|nr:hypothetical protein [Elusimicrobiota bacterium]